MLLDDLVDYLTSGGITTTMYRDFMAEQPDDCLQLIESGGMGATHAMASGPGQAVEEHCSVQIVRRSPSFDRARVEMNVVFTLLDGLGDRTINGTRYLWVEAKQSPYSLGDDLSNRRLVACNFDIWKAISTATST